MKFPVTFLDSVMRSSAAMRLVFLMLLLISPAYAADGPIVAHLEVTQPRSFGYQLGDKFEREVTLVLSKPWTVIDDSLPIPGRLNRWLNVERTSIRSVAFGTATHYNIVIEYQVGNVDEDKTDIDIPHHVLQITDGSEQLGVSIRAARTRVSRLTDPSDTAIKDNDVPQAQVYNPARLLVPGFILALTVLGLLILRLRLPVFSRAEPFTVLFRELRNLARSDWSDAQYRSVLQKVHAAFNETAGKTVFEGELDSFYEVHPHFKVIAEKINAYFESSRTCFFDQNAAVADSLSKDDLLDLVGACSDAERGIR